MANQDIKEFARYTKKILSVEEMRAIDRNLYALNIPVLTLMENAGMAVANFVSDRVRGKKNILVVCGTGKNGGDGFVAARALSDKHNVTVALLAQRQAVRAEEARTNLEALQGTKAKVIENAQYHMDGLLADSDAVIVAVFGIGFHGEMPEDIAQVIGKINKSGKMVFAVDVPSGLGRESSKKHALKADYTITMHKMKDILVKNPIAGKVVVADVGIPAEAELYAGPGDVDMAVMPRDPYSSKRDNGTVMVVGGSAGYHGAPSLASNAAYSTLASIRAGAGYALTFVPKSVVTPVRSLSPNLIVRQLSGDNLSAKDLKQLEEQAKKSDSIAIGPGLGRERESLDAAADFIASTARLGKRMVVDADALHAVPLIKKKLGRNVVLTPNDHEFEIFHKQKLKPADLRARIEAAISVATRLGTNVLLKGHETVVTDGERLKIVAARSASLATMGTGDVLTGIIAGLAARTNDMFAAAVAGAYVHTAAGEALHRLKGDHILASDVIDYMPQVLKEFDRSR